MQITLFLKKDFLTAQVEIAILLGVNITCSGLQELILTPEQMLDIKHSCSE